MVALLVFTQAVFGLIFRLPPRAAIWLLRLKARGLFWLARLTPVRRTVSANYRAFFPTADGEALADKLLANISQSIFEVLCFPFFRAPHFQAICRLEGRENLDLALTDGRGVLLLTMHTGNYELMQVLLPQLGYRLNAVMKAAPGDRLFDLINRSRTATGCRLINVETDNMYRESLARLAENEIVGLLIDTGARESRNETITFLGKKMPAAIGWLTLAQRSAANLVIATCRRDGDRLIVRIGPPFRITTENRDAMKEHVRRTFDEFVTAHPDQWALFLDQDEIGRIVQGNE
ncbi:MAG: lysophospholipid acyltransferase family protein [Candidatus Margulisbacteria bacterium]|jgi:KDO2-lipid IV(A) lauroyltransferase|nr:lysophospholipid acyltransferase family protein [Candidatus Margulisiibacteriota bacterium]